MYTISQTQSAQGVPFWAAPCNSLCITSVPNILRLSSTRVRAPPERMTATTYTSYYMALKQTPLGWLLTNAAHFI